MDTRTTDRADLQQLAETLWEERHVVEELLYRLTCARLLLTADEHRFVPSAIDEIDHVVDRLRGIEMHREGLLADVAASLDLDDALPSLGELAASSPSPFDRVFEDHRDAFIRLADEIESTTATNRELATAALGRIRSAIDALSGAPSTVATYDAAGRPAAAGVGPMRMDRSL